MSQRPKIGERAREAVAARAQAAFDFVQVKAIVVPLPVVKKPIADDPRRLCHLPPAGFLAKALALRGQIMERR